MKEETATSEDLLDEQAMLYSLGSLEGQERQQFETCLQCPHSSAPAKLAEYTSLVGIISAALHPEKAPSPELRQRIMAAISPPAPPAVPESLSLPAAIRFLMQNEGTWHSTPFPGVRLRELSNASADMAVFMLHLDAGTTYPDHDHHGAEDMYLLSGDLDINGTRMGPGDFMHSEPGSHHHQMHSFGGCQAIAITSRKNYSPTMMRAYSTMDRVKTTVRRLLGKGGPVSP